MVARPCLGCQRVTTAGSYCPSCRAGLVAKRNAERGSPRQRGYDAHYERLRAALIAGQPWCSLCLSADDLTADHIIPVSKGGLSVASNLRVLCRRCNSRRGAGRC